MEVKKSNDGIVDECESVHVSGVYIYVFDEREKDEEM